MTNAKPDMNKISEIIAAAAAANVDHPSILPELEALLDPLTPEQYKELENAVLEEGIKDKIIVWDEQNVVADGHNRLSLAKKHGLPYETERKSFADVEAVKRWMIRRQLGRRNLTKERFTYYIGALYNATKQDRTAQREENPDNKPTSQIIGDQFGVSEKTVRRAGEVAAGLDRLAKIKGQIEKAKVLDGKSNISRDDLTVIGQIKDDKIAEKVINKIEAKAQEKEEAKKTAPKTPAPAAAPKKNGFTYPVIFMKPQFEGLSPLKAEKPPLAKEGIVYMAVNDEDLQQAFKLIDAWDLNFEASFVFTGIKPYDGVLTKIAHQFMLVVTRGHVAGPKAGKEKNSAITVNGDAEAMMIKIIEAYHGDAKKLDMRKDAKASKDWAVIEK